MNMAQSIRTSAKVKRCTKEKEKRKILAGYQEYDSAINDKISCTVDDNSKGYAGLWIENIKAAAEHVTFPDLLSEQSCETLAEDLNYKLRYIIHQAANRAFISNRTSISSIDIEETFNDLQVDKVYGAPAQPSWISLGDHNYLFLDDARVDMIKGTEEDVAYPLYRDPKVDKKWLPELEDPSYSLKHYFKIMSAAVVSHDIDVRKMALQNISSNPHIGPIINWFYKFGYILLSKEVVHDSLTLYALDLIEILEMSPLGNTEASVKQLKLLVRLILQRALSMNKNPKLLKPMSWVLRILCGRISINKLVVMKLKQKLPKLSIEYLLPYLMILNTLGINTIMEIFLKHFEVFFTQLSSSNSFHAVIKRNKLHNYWQYIIYTIMETYQILFKNNILDQSLNVFPQLETFMIFLNRPQHPLVSETTRTINFIQMKKELLKTRRKIEVQRNLRYLSYESVFEVPVYKKRMKQKMENHYKTNYHMGWKKKSYVVIGKTSLLLPVMKIKDVLLPRCYDHSLFSYNL